MSAFKSQIVPKTAFCCSFFHSKKWQNCGQTGQATTMMKLPKKKTKNDSILTQSQERTDYIFLGKTNVEKVLFSEPEPNNRKTATAQMVIDQKKNMDKNCVMVCKNDTSAKLFALPMCCLRLQFTFVGLSWVCNCMLYALYTTQSTAYTTGLSRCLMWNRAAKRKTFSYHNQKSGRFYARSMRMRMGIRSYGYVY